jgi:hypothetical protein
MQRRVSDPEQREALLRAFADHLRPHLEAVRRRIPEGKTHPVQSALFGAYVALLDDYIATSEKILTGSHPIDQTAVENSKALQLQIKKIAEWIALHGEFRDYEAGDFLVETGYSYTRATEILDRAKKSRAGAPHSAAKRTIDALEMKISAPSLTWSALADKTCDCGASKHTKHCAERVRKNVASLKNLLASYPDHWPPRSKRN